MLHAPTHSVTLDNQPVWPSFLHIFVKLCFLEPENIRDTEWLFHEKRIPGQLSLGNIINSILSLKSYNEHNSLKVMKTSDKFICLILLNTMFHKLI